MAKYFFAISLMVILVSCSGLYTPQTAPEWKYTDLISLDPADASSGDLDLIAVYTRELENDLQIRLDYLEMGETIQHDLYLAMDVKPGGEQRLPLNEYSDIPWDFLIQIPSSGPIVFKSMDTKKVNNLGLRISRNPVQDYVQISVNKLALLGSNTAPWGKNNKTLQVFTTTPNSVIIADSSDPMNINDPPPAPADILFVFWNTLPAYSPALTLRKWDGAHTGPYGGRHGLYNLLRTANSSHIPLVLLDLKSPTVLSALEFAGGMELIHEMDRKGLLILPTPLPDSQYSPLFMSNEGYEQFAKQAEHIAKKMDLHTSSSFYSPDGWFSNSFKPEIVFRGTGPFASTLESYQVPIMHHDNKEIISVPLSSMKELGTQTNSDGLSKEVRKSLIETALQYNADETVISLLGGNLQDSSWGVPEISRAGFQYIKSHPWIHAMNIQDLINIHARSAEFTSFENTRENIISNQMREENNQTSSGVSIILDDLPENKIGQITRDFFWSSFNPVHPYPEELKILRSKYIPNLRILLAAAEWAEQPYRKVTCNEDIDSDGSVECMLISKDSFTVIELEGGYISFMFVIGVDGTHQIIGPSSQFISGTSDPIFWDLRQNHHIEPGYIAGAFEDPDSNYVSDASFNSITLSNQDLGVSKKYSLEDDEVRISYNFKQLDKEYHTKLPLVIDPWHRFEKNWPEYYKFRNIPDGILWTLGQENTIHVKTTGNMNVDTFNVSRDYFTEPENPNFDYPAGHNLPYPMVLMNINSRENFYVEISWNKD